MIITAPLIHDGTRFLPEGSALHLSEEGIITEILTEAPGDSLVFEDVICPGFINAHCHLELSHLKGAIPEGLGLMGFLGRVPATRTLATTEEKRLARHAAFQAMLEEGVVAVGDICNTSDTLDLRAQGRMHFHSFVEALGFSQDLAGKSFAGAEATFNQFVNQDSERAILRQTIVPHAPYSVAPALFRLINAHRPGSLLSIHNQESEDEDAYYFDKSGGVNSLLSGFGIDTAWFEPSGKKALPTYLEWLSPDHPMLFVHNTYTDKEELELVKGHFQSAYWCLCPNANLYIEGKLPDVNMFIDSDAAICLGTDSLSSNHQLSIFSEVLTLNRSFPELGWERLLRWATSGGARALQMEDRVGSLKPGMQPGILQLRIKTDRPAVKRVDG